MARLPDIPVGDWLRDQEELFGRKIGGLFPALEFQAATTEQQAEIPPDISMPGGEDTYQREQEYMRQLQEEQARRDEEERQRQEQARQQQILAEQEQQRQQQLAAQASEQANSLGILTPDSALDHFRSLTGTHPGLGDSASSSGALEAPNLDTPSYQTPAQTTDPYDLSGEQPPAPTPQTVQTPQDFQQYADGLNQQTFGPENPKSVDEQSSQIASDEFQAGLKKVWDDTGNVIGYIKSTAEDAAPIAEAAFKAARLPNPYALGRTASKGVEESVTPEGSGLHNQTNFEGLSDTLRQPLLAAERLGFSVVTLALPASIAGNLWKDVGLPVPKIGEFEINPGQFLVPVPKGVGGELANKAEVATTRAGQALADRIPDIAPAIESGAGAAIGAVGRGIGRGASALGDAVGSGGVYLDRLAGKVYDDAKESIRLVFPDAPEAQIDQAAQAIRAKQLPRAEAGAPGSRRMFHGGNVGNNLVNPDRFDESGLFGPAHYVTTSPDVAAHYAELGNYQGSESVMRAANLDDRAVLFNAEKPVPQADLRKIRDSLHRQFGDDPSLGDVLQEYDMLADAPSDYYRRTMRDTDGRSFYEQLSRDITPPEQWKTTQEYGGAETEIGDKRLVNQVLSDAGFDGVFYNGETVGVGQGGHDAVAVFPEKLDALKNAFTGEMGGAVASREPGAADYALRSLPARRAVGAVTGAVAGATAGDENTSPTDRAVNIGLGSSLGALSADRGTMAAARLVDSLIARGALSSDVLVSHPPTADRIRALFALAAKNLPDQAPVDLPGMVQFLTRAEPEVRQEVSSLIDGPKTAGEIRQLLGGFDPGRLGREARDLIVDLAAGVGGRGRRASETRADRASIEGLGREGRLPWDQSSPEFAGSRIRTPDGPARELNDPDMVARVHDVADQLGVDRPVVYVSDNADLNAAATRGAEGGSKIALTQGLLDANLSPEEFDALITHELAHTTEQSFGQQLLGRAQDLLGSARGQGPSIPEKGIWRSRVMNGIQAPKGTPEWLQKNLELTYNESMRLLGKSQAERSTAKRDRFQADASKAWEKHQEWLTRAQEEVQSRAPSRPTRPPRPAREAVPARDEPPVSVLPDTGEPTDFAGTDPGRLSPAEPGRVEGSGDPTRVGEVPSGVDETPSFESEPLPTELSPSQQWTHEDAGKLVGQLKDALVMNPTLREKTLAGAADMVSRPKVRGRHIEQLLQWVGERQAVPRGITKEEAGAAWKDKFLRDNGWIAPAEAQSSEAAASLGVRGVDSPPRELDAAPTIRPEDSAPVRAPQRNATTDVAGPSDAELSDLERRFSEARPNPDLPDAPPIEDLADGQWGNAVRRKVDPAVNPPPTERDPRYDALQTRTPPAPLTNPGIFERMYRTLAPKLTDTVAVLRQYQDDVAREYLKQTGTVIPADVLAAELKRLDPNRAAEMDADRLLKPALRIFRSLGISDETINTYLSYVHDIDVAGAKGNPNRQLPSGATLQQAKDFVARRDMQWTAQLKPEQRTALNEGLQSVWDMGDHILQLKRDAGLINDDTYNTLRATYPHYIPTKILDFINDDTRLGVGQSLSVNSSTIHELSQSGTTREALDALPAMLGALYEAHSAANKNRVFNAFDQMVVAAKLMQPGITGSGASGRRVGELAGLVFARPPGTKRANEFTQVRGFINGVKQELWVHKSLGDVTKFDAPTVIPIMSGLTAAFKAGATSRNPIFLTANAMLDLSTYMIREMSRAGGPQHFGDVLGVYGATMGEFLPVGAIGGTFAGGYAGSQTVTPEDSALTAAGKIVGGAAAGTVLGAGVDRLRGNHVLSDIASHEYRGDMERFLSGGGGSSGLVGTGSLRPEPVNWKGFKLDVDDLLQKLGWRQESELEKGVRQLGQSMFEVNNAKEFAEKAWDLLTLKPVEALGERIELVPRVAAMRLAERRGASGVEAVNAGRTTTLDFNKGGSWTRTINQVIPFFNVGIQGATEVQRAFAQNPVAFPATVGTVLVAPMIGAEIWNQMDPQRRKDYADVPNYIKDQGLVLMLPTQAPVDAQGNRHPQFFHFRYREFAPLAMLTRETMQRWYFNNASDEDRRSLGELGMSGIQQLSPVSVADPADFATSFLPPGLGTMVQASPQVDRDFFRGARIRSQYADERASPLSKAAGPALGMRPSVFEFASRDVGTGFAGMLHGASEILFGDKPDSPQSQPVTGGLTGRVIKGSIGNEANTAREHTITDSAERVLSNSNVKWRPSPADPQIGNVPLTRAEYADYQQQVNRVTDEAIHRIAANPRFDSLNAAAKEAAIQRAVTTARESVQYKILGSIPRDVRVKRVEDERAKGRLPARVGG